MADFSKFGIRIPLGVTGNVKVICPQCTPHNRKPKNRNSKDLSVNISEGIWNCHNCGWSGTLKEKKEYVKPIKIELPMSEKGISWFKNRGINENTLKAFGISEKKEYMPQVSTDRNCLIFPYFKNEEAVNYKFRDGSKNFKMVSGAELVIFNYDKVFGKKKIMIVEGEIDCLSVYECGFYDVCSVPNGATKGNQRLEYLDNSWMAFSEATEVIIATDNDEAGIALKNELARRLGKERCLYVKYPKDSKDFNEVLLNHGQAKVWECIKSAEFFPLEGIYRVLDFTSEMDNIYANGFKPGVKIGYPKFDEHFNFSEGQLTVVTGVPNSGKSAFLDQIILKLAELHKWPFGVCSFENQPITRHLTLLASCYIGKPFYRHDPKNKMAVEEYAKAMEFLHNYFFFFKIKDEDVTIDGILSRAMQLVRTQGIKGLVIDPWNYLEHIRGAGQTETEYVSELLTKICNFAKEYEVHVFLVAHPTKIAKSPITKDFEVPNLYSISGSAHFFNKTDNGLTVYRNRETNVVTVYIQKVRFFINGSIGNCEFNYDVHSGRYSQIGEQYLPMEVEKPSAGIINRYPVESRESNEEETPF